MKNRSVDPNLFTLANSILVHINYNNVVIKLIFFDFCKAFDKIDQDISLRKLTGISVHGDLLRCFSSYISNKCHTVTIGMY